MRSVPKYPKKKTNTFYVGESDGLQAGDSIGNRQKFSETRISADDIGNRLTAASLNEVVRDDIGNMIGGAPTHQQSGILASFDGRMRRRREPSTVERSGSSYVVGGVNPLVSGSQALLSMFSPKEDEVSDVPVRSIQIPVALSEPIARNNAGARSEGEDGRRSNRKNEKTTDSSDRWLKRLLELDDDERIDATSSGDPKLKATQARAVLSEIFEKAGVMAAIGTEIVFEANGTRPCVLVSFEDIDLSVDANCRLSQVFAQDSISLLALNFLVNKIVNRIPEDRVRVQVLLRGTVRKSAEPANPQPVAVAALGDADDLTSH